MRARISVAVLGALPTSALALALVASPASAQVCDAYSGGCPPAAVGGVGQDAGTGAPAVGGGQGRSTGGSADIDRQLPFTGGELVSALLAGSAAITAGAALYAAGRHRAADTPSSVAPS